MNPSSKTRCLLSFLFVALSCWRSAAQSDADALHPDFAKVNVLALPLKNLSVQYEKVLSHRISAALGIRYMPLSAVPLKGIANNYVGDDQDARDFIDKSRIGNFAATPELRIYLGKGYGQGFYLAPYYRYARFWSNTVIINYTATAGPKRSVTLNGNASAHTGGIMAGAQWFLGNRFVLDWWILGAHWGAGNGSFTGVPNPALTPGEQEDVRTTLEDVDIPMVNKTVTVTANRVRMDLDGTFGGLRTGVLFGIRF